MSGHSSGIEITDDRGRKHVFENLPRRIVSLVPSLTETLVFLGSGERLVGITDYCTEPSQALGDLPRVGGPKNPNIDKIFSLSPDIVIANREENRESDVKALEERVRVYVTYPRTVLDAIQVVRNLGTLVGASEQAGRFASKCQGLLRSIRRDASVSRPLRTACMIWYEPWMAAGPDTYMSDLLDLLGFKNVLKMARASGRYPEVTLEEVIAQDPDVIFLPDEPYPFGKEHEAMVEHVLRKRRPNARVRLVSGRFLAWYGSRTSEALRYLRRIKQELL